MGEEEERATQAFTLVISEKYFDDLEQIVDYISLVKLQPLNAIKVGDGIQKTMKKIVLNPTIYSECENIPSKSKKYREAVFKTWRIIFKMDSNTVNILGVLSGKRKPSNFRKLKE